MVGSRRENSSKGIIMLRIVQAGKMTQFCHKGKASNIRAERNMGEREKERNGKR